MFVFLTVSISYSEIPSNSKHNNPQFLSNLAYNIPRFLLLQELLANSSPTIFRSRPWLSTQILSIGTGRTGTYVDIVKRSLKANNKCLHQNWQIGVSSSRWYLLRTSMSFRETPSTTEPKQQWKVVSQRVSAQPQCLGKYGENTSWCWASIVVSIFQKCPQLLQVLGILVTETGLWSSLLKAVQTHIALGSDLTGLPLSTTSLTLIFWKCSSVLIQLSSWYCYAVGSGSCLAPISSSRSTAWIKLWSSPSLEVRYSWSLSLAPYTLSLIPPMMDSNQVYYSSVIPICLQTVTVVAQFPINSWRYLI